MSADQLWQDASMGRLTEHILGTHHAYLHRQLPFIANLLLQSVRTHWRKHPELMQAQMLFTRMQSELDQHLIQEETAGFPLLGAHDHDASVRIDPFANTLDQHVAAHASVMHLLDELRGCLWSY